MTAFVFGTAQTVVSNLGSALYGLAATAVVGLLLFPVRTFLKNVQGEWQAVTAKLSGVEKELSVQRTNCLTTLQQQGQSQIDLLEKANNTLEAIHLSQVEMSGYLKASRDRN
jgi:hypothetical protein